VQHELDLRLSPELSAVVNENDELTSGDSHVVRQQVAVKEKTVAKRNLKHSISVSSKRARLVSVDHLSDRYRELRDKNNEAARKSRLNRKAREREMREAAAKFERDNHSLKIKVGELEQLVKRLREELHEATIKSKKSMSTKVGE
jgi:hypothetical protein